MHIFIKVGREGRLIKEEKNTYRHIFHCSHIGYLNFIAVRLNSSLSQKKNSRSLHALNYILSCKKVTFLSTGIIGNFFTS